jgi:Na+/phosphate symporter
MGILSEKVQTETYLLVIAGIIMTVTLWLSKKARTVTETEIGLSSQNEGEEKFGSSFFARLLVRRSLSANSNFKRILPAGIQKNIEKRFTKTETAVATGIDPKDLPAFDMIRASVNLTVASILIAIGTSLKLPLSTTYVTFMVAMGTSLSDRAWGRDSAVYRITGVITVIGGWFFTAFIAFTAAFIFANLINWLGGFAIVGLLTLAVVFVVRSHIFHKKKSTEKEQPTEEDDTIIIKGGIFEQLTYAVSGITVKIPKLYGMIINGLAFEDRAKLKECNKKARKLDKEAKSMKNQVPAMMKKLTEDSIATGPFYVQLIDYLREIAHSISFIASPAYDYVDNNHKTLIKEQVNELNIIQTNLDDFFRTINRLLKDSNYESAEIDKALAKQKDLLASVRKARKEQIKRIKSDKVGTRNSVLYLGLLNETKNLVLHAGNLLKASRDFSGIDSGQAETIEE